MDSVELESPKSLADRLKKATLEMKELEAAIKSLDTQLDPRLLTDFRDVTDHIRTTAWTIQFWMAQQKTSPGGKDLFGSLLTAERMRRATQLCNDLARDLEQMPIGPAMRGNDKFEGLYRAVERLTQPLAPLFKRP